jgi:hypothetical protein
LKFDEFPPPVGDDNEHLQRSERQRLHRERWAAQSRGA